MNGSAGAGPLWLVNFSRIAKVEVVLNCPLQLNVESRQWVGES